MKSKPSHGTHLVINDLALRPGGEWEPTEPDWLLAQVRSGSGYWMQPGVTRELPPGSVLLRAESVRGRIRASQLGAMSLACFRVDTELMTGLATLGEQRFLETAASREDLALQVLPPGHPVAVRFKNLDATRNGNRFPFRLRLLQLFIEIFGKRFDERAPEPARPVEARERLREFLNQIPASDLLDLNFSDLVRMMNCTPRHLSRVFQQVVGMSFREKQAKIRLARARELLATTESKVVDVALESGYQSLSLFNLMFRKRFGMSPGRWRQKQQTNGNKPQRRPRLVCMNQL